MKDNPVGGDGVPPQWPLSLPLPEKPSAISRFFRYIFLGEAVVFKEIDGNKTYYRVSKEKLLKNANLRDRLVCPGRDFYQKLFESLKKEQSSSEESSEGGTAAASATAASATATPSTTATSTQSDYSSEDFKVWDSTGKLKDMALSRALPLRGELEKLGFGFPSVDSPIYCVVSDKNFKAVDKEKLVDKEEFKNAHPMVRAVACFLYKHQKCSHDAQIELSDEDPSLKPAQDQIREEIQRRDDREIHNFYSTLSQILGDEDKTEKKLSEQFEKALPEYFLEKPENFRKLVDIIVEALRPPIDKNTLQEGLKKKGVFNESPKTYYILENAISAAAGLDSATKLADFNYDEYIKEEWALVCDRCSHPSVGEPPLGPFITVVSPPATSATSN